MTRFHRGEAINMERENCSCSPKRDARPVSRTMGKISKWPNEGPPGVRRSSIRQCYESMVPCYSGHYGASFVKYRRRKPGASVCYRIATVFPLHLPSFLQRRCYERKFLTNFPRKIPFLPLNIPFKILNFYPSYSRFVLNVASCRVIDGKNVFEINLATLIKIISHFHRFPSIPGITREPINVLRTCLKHVELT